MAGRGPAPAETRRRNNVPARGEWVDLAPLGAPVLAPANAEWPEHVRVLWEAWRSDPVTSQYAAGDLAAIAELARRYDKLQASEQRLRMDGLGLTPKGKRDLRWRVGGDVAEPKKRRQAPAASKRRARLSVVE